MKRETPFTDTATDLHCSAVFHENPVTGGHWCGYVLLPEGHKHHGAGYDDIPASVHGGLTYAASEGDWWKIGFDCAHAGDTVANCGLEYVMRELRSLCQQMARAGSGWDEVQS